MFTQTDANKTQKIKRFILKCFSLFVFIGYIFLFLLFTLICFFFYSNFCFFFLFGFFSSEINWRNFSLYYIITFQIVQTNDFYHVANGDRTQNLCTASRALYPLVYSGTCLVYARKRYASLFNSPI